MPPWRSSPYLSGTRFSTLSCITPSSPFTRTVTLRGIRVNTQPATSRPIRIRRLRIEESISSLSCLRVTGASRVRLGPGTAEDGGGLGAVALQLALQFIGGGEPAHIPEPLHPFQAHPLAVEIALEAEEVHLERAPAVTERGLTALVHHPAHPAAAPLHPDGVNPVGRQQLLRGDLAEIDRRHSEHSAPPLAGHHLPGDTIGPAEQASRRAEIAARHRPTDAPARDRLPAQVHRRHHVHRESELGPEASEGLDVAAPAAAEAMVIPEHQLPHAAARQQYLPHEGLGREIREPAVEPDE